MARTYRRKNLKRRWYNYDNEEHFDRLKQLTESGNPFPEEYRGYCGWGHTAPEALKDHREAELFDRFSRQKPTYREYVAHEDAMFHSERGWHHHGRVWRGMGGDMNGDDRNLSFERPHRRAIKQFIHRCVVQDAWDNTIIPDYKSRGWWMYYD